MADTPIFESEKHMELQRKRRTLIIILAIVLAVCAAAAIVIFAVIRSGRTHIGGDDLPFQYTWRQNSDGSAVFRVDREGKLVWRISDPGEAYGTVGIAAGGIRNGASEFKLTPISEGRSIMRIVLGAQEDTANDKYRMELMAESYLEGGKLRCRVLTASCKSLFDADVTEGDYQYRIFTDDDGDVIIEIPSNETDWECEASNENTTGIVGLIYGDGCVRAYLRPGSQTGTCEVLLRSSFEGKELKAVFSLNDEGELSLSQDAASTFEPTVTPTPDYELFPTSETVTATPNP